MRARVQGVRDFFRAVPQRERWALAGILGLSSAIVLVYIAITHPIEFVGDLGEYHSEGVFFTEGKLWWTTLPYGIAHAGMWKAPIYPAWIGFWYEVLGASPTRVAVVQGLVLAPLGVLGTWLLGRRLFGPLVGLAAAAIIAVFPLVWEFYGLLYPEVLAVPAVLLVLYLFLERPPTARLALAVGIASGVGILIRPTSVFLFAGVLAAWILAAGWRRGIGLTALSVAIAALVVAPWTVRNAIVADGFVPISLQDIAVYGTFNDEAANDPVYPYAWRYQLADPPDVLDGPPVGDAELRSELQKEAIDYVREHPFSVVEAFYWNGLSRFWDVRRPARPIDEAPFEGRSKTVTTVGVVMYYPLLIAALVGLWRIRSRRTLAIPLLAVALGASLVFAVGAATRYRAPLEPVIAILAVAAFAPVARPPATDADPRPAEAAPERAPASA